MSPTLVMVEFPLFQKPSYLTAQCYLSLTIVYKHNHIQDKFYTHTSNSFYGCSVECPLDHTGLNCIHCGLF